MNNNILPSEIYGTAPDGTVLNWYVATPSGTGTFPAALVLHVGGFRSGNPGPVQVAQDLATVGFLALAIEYHLAPPAKSMPQQVSPGYYPLQHNDVKMAIRAARSDSRCNGKVVGVGGSAGGSHVVYCCSTGSPEDDKLDAGASLSGAYDYSDPSSLNDAHRKTFKNDVINYVHSSDPGDLRAASPVSFINADMSGVILLDTDNDPMPPHQLEVMVAELQAQGVTDFTSRVLNEPNQPDGFTRHAFQYWQDVKVEVITFLKSHI